MHSEHEVQAPLRTGMSLSRVKGRRANSRRALIVSVAAHVVAAMFLGAVVVWQREEAKQDADAELVDAAKLKPKLAPRRTRPPVPERSETPRPAFAKPIQIQTAAKFTGGGEDGFYIPAGNAQSSPAATALKAAPALALSVPMQARPAAVDFGGQIKMDDWTVGSAPISASLTSAAPGLSSMVTAPRGANQRAEEFEAFKSAVREAIQRAQEYPHFARAQEIEGRLALSILLKRDGTIAEVTVETSSGSDILDAAAVKSVQRAGRLTAFPESVQAASMRLSIPVRFDLEGV